MSATDVEKAYGLLWRECGGSKRVTEARRLLLGLLDKDGQRRGIEYANARYGATTEREILEHGE